MRTLHDRIVRLILTRFFPDYSSAFFYSMLYLSCSRISPFKWIFRS